VTNEEEEFCEDVRGKALRIASLIMSGRYDDAGQAALALCTFSAQRRRHILGLPEPEPDGEDEDALDLADLNSRYGDERE
jgi:hypothetical protein